MQLVQKSAAKRGSGLVVEGRWWGLEKENGPEAHMMDKRLLRQFPMAQGHHSNRPTKQEDQQVSYGNGNKGSAPPKLEENADV